MPNEVAEKVSWGRGSPGYFNKINNINHYTFPSQVPCYIWLCYTLFPLPYLFDKKFFFSMQDKLLNNKQTLLLKQNFSATITPINKRCGMLINL